MALDVGNWFPFIILDQEFSVINLSSILVDLFSDSVGFGNFNCRRMVVEELMQIDS